MEQDDRLIGSEPIKFTYRSNSGFMERYSALIGANDPYAFITGVYDRQNYLNNKWTGLKIDQIDKDKYIVLTLKPKTIIPTIGANGTIFRTIFLQQNLNSDYLNNKINLEITNISSPLDYEIIYIGNKVEKGISGHINSDEIVNSKFSKDFYLGTCSTGENCTSEIIEKGSTVTVNLTNGITLTKTFKY
jgi:hypothetical protein